VYRDALVPLAVALAGALAGYIGAVTVITALLGSRRSVAGDARERRRQSVRTLEVGIGVVALAVVLVIGAGVAVSGARDDARASSVMRCNGAAVLCDRRIDQVAFAGSHNSMSAALDPGWLFGENLTGIPDQLEYGIRAFLVKTHYGIPTGLSLGET